MEQSVADLISFLTTLMFIILLGLGVFQEFNEVEKKLDKIIATQQPTTTTQPKVGN